ncbi:MAG TPA: hypothetical protein VNO22_07410 [Planctomycetota bacterium]|jgi:hypothetical protein|nr:hypothetical protein [Planctomycetota bacterium]
MNHLGDDELLERALEGGLRPDAESHLRECAFCARRFEAVQGEQEAIRRALAVEGGPRPRRSVRRRTAPVWAGAALGIAAAVAVAWGVAGRAPRSVDPPRALTIRRLEREIERLVRAIGAQRQVLRPEEQEEARAFGRMLVEAERRYAELVGLYVAEAAPLSERQKAEIVRLLDEAHQRALSDEERGEVALRFRAALREVLDGSQFAAFEHFVRHESEEAWKREVDAVADDLADALDLKFSESEAVRKALLASGAGGDFPDVPVWESPSDVLAGSPLLARVVREALHPERRAAFDVYLEAARRSREGARQVALRYRAP